MAETAAITSREYKVMLDHRMFVDRKRAAGDMWREMARINERLKSVKAVGEFEKTKKRSIVFFESRDGTVLRNGLVFRQRTDVKTQATEYTLKCRSPDRFVANGAQVHAADGLKKDAKFEEDIGAPFVPRYSRSNTVEGTSQRPKDFDQAAKLYPVFKGLMRDGEQCPGSTELHPTTSVELFERVLTGPTFRLKRVEAEVALILWSDGADGRPLVAEFSFRYADKQGKFSSKAASAAMDLFAEVQRLDWCLPHARTKTQYAYGEA